MYFPHLIRKTNTYNRFSFCLHLQPKIFIDIGFKLKKKVCKFHDTYGIIWVRSGEYIVVGANSSTDKHILIKFEVKKTFSKWYAPVVLLVMSFFFGI